MIKFVCSNPQDFVMDYEKIGVQGLRQKIKFGVSETEKALIRTIENAFSKPKTSTDVTEVFEFQYSSHEGPGYVPRETVWGQLKKMFRIKNIELTNDGHYVVEVEYVPEKKYTVKEMKEIVEEVINDFYNTVYNCDTTDFKLIPAVDFDHYEYKRRKVFYINEDEFTANLNFYRLVNDGNSAKDTSSKDEATLELAISKKSIDNREEVVAFLTKKISKKFGCKIDSYILGKRYRKEWKYSDGTMENEAAFIASLEQLDNYKDLIEYERIDELYKLLIAKNKGLKNDGRIGTVATPAKVNGCLESLGDYNRHFQMWDNLERLYEGISSKERTIKGGSSPVGAFETDLTEKRGKK